MTLEVRRRLRDLLEPLLVPIYESYGPKHVQFERVQRWVFVCHGNICRSPFGEWWARRQGIAATSCGLEGIPGKPADPTASRCALELGVDMRGHEGRRLSEFAVHDHDLIVAFDPAHIAACKQAVRSNRAQVMLLGLALPSPRVRIRDPFGAADDVFESVFRDTDRALVSLECSWRAARPS